MTRLIAVGSTNPVKVRAVTQAAQAVFNDTSIISFKTASSVSDMPLSKQEARAGARNRAVRAREDAEAWLGVGLEGGTCWIDGELYLFSTTFATDGTRGSFGGETLIKIPQEIAKIFGDGTTELGEIMDQVTGTENIKQKEGAVGYLTNGVLTRTEVFRQSTIMALANWL